MFYKKIKDQQLNNSRTSWKGIRALISFLLINHLLFFRCFLELLIIHYHVVSSTFKLKLILAVIALATSASAFAPSAAFSRTSMAIHAEGDEAPELGAGGMADTRDPDAKVDEDSRKSISAAPSFEEYLKQRDSE